MKFDWLRAALAIPLTSAVGWQNLKFSGIPQNQLQFSQAGLEIKVQKSSSPLVFALAQPMMVTGFKAELEIEGDMNEPDKNWPEDSYLRLGFVAPGSRHLGTMERMIAADWIKRLFKLVPENSGVDKIYFFSLIGPALFTGKKRVFPKSKGLMEEVIAASRSPVEKTVTFHHQFTSPLNSVALWLSSDGDDTKSSFTLVIKKLELTGNILKDLR